MKNLKEKLRKNGGFTLVEMLIVVAIIAILIAVSIPMVGASLERSRHAVDQANERDAISLGSVVYLTGQDSDGKDIAWADGKVTLIYTVDDNHQGRLVPTGTGVKAECQCSEAGYHNGGTLSVEIDQATGSVTPNWSATNGAAAGGAGG